MQLLIMLAVTALLASLDIVSNVNFWALFEMSPLCRVPSSNMGFFGAVEFYTGTVLR